MATKKSRRPAPSETASSDRATPKVASPARGKPDPVTPETASPAEPEPKLATFLHARHSDTLPGLQADLDSLEQRIGRPPAEIDLDTVERLAAMLCTDEEIAAFFGVGIRTIERRKKKAEFSERLAQGRNRGKISLRRLQWMTANSGDRASVVMQIWLGKQILNQKDRVSNEHSGIDGGPIEISDVRAKLEELLNKRRAGALAKAKKEAESEKG